MRYILFILLNLLFIMPGALAQSSDEPVIYLTPQNQQVDNFVDNDDIDDSPIVIQNVTPSEMPLASSVHAKHIARLKPHVQMYGPTTPQDHIWHLAEKLRPNTKITVPQMIIALQQANPNAFVSANINDLKSGQKLRIPGLFEIQLVDPQLAAEIVNKQTVAWKKAAAPLVPALLASQNKPITAAVANKNCVTGLCGFAKNTLVNNSPKPTLAVMPTPRYVPLTNATAVLPVAKEKIVTASESTATKSEKATAVLASTIKSTIKSAITPVLVAAKENNITANKNSVNPVITKTTPSVIPLANATEVLPLPTKTRIKPVKPAVINNNATAVAAPAVLTKTNEQPVISKPEVASTLAVIPTEDLKAEQQIRRDDKLIANLQNQLAEQKKTTLNTSAASASGAAMLLPKTKVGWWIATIAVFLVVLLWLPSPRRNKTAKVEERREPTVSNNEEIDLEDEYDFMNSDEALPAKLDLANAYIAMEDYQSAEQVLQEILIKGNEAERKEARLLLKKIIKVK